MAAESLVSSSNRLTTAMFRACNETGAELSLMFSLGPVNVYAALGVKQFGQLVKDSASKLLNQPVAFFFLTLDYKA